MVSILNIRRVKKILHIITALDVGGAQRVVIDLAESAAKADCEVTIVYLLKGTEFVLSKYQEIQVISLEMRGIQDVFSALWKLRNVIKKTRPDIVHAHLFHAIILSRIVRIFIKIPRLVCTIHSSVDGGAGRRFCYRVTNFLNENFTNVSEESAGKIVCSGIAKKENMTVIQNGIDIEKYKFSPTLRDQARKLNGIDRNEVFILAVGRLEEAKDYFNLLRAIQFLIDKNKIKNIKLFIAGDGTLRKKLEDFSIKINISNHVTFLGMRNDIVALMCASDVYVLSSLYEGLPLVVAEAMACECMVVATDCGGVREVVDRTGYLVPPRDHIALAQAIQTALKLNDEQRRELTTKARKRIVNHYSLKTMYDKYRMLYEGEFV